MNFNVKKLTVISMLIAVEIILTRFLAITTPIVRIGFGFLPTAVIAIMYGPVYAGLAAAIADIIGMILFPSGAYFPGFTLTAFLTGVTYGIFLHNKKINIINISAAVIVIAIVLNLGLDTVWLQIITGKAYLALFPARIIKCIIVAPVQILLISLISNEKILLPLKKRL